MKLRAVLPLDREAEGHFTVTDDDGASLFGPIRCRGEADNTQAMAHQNPEEVPARSVGDHPYGMYKVGNIVQEPRPTRSYGPFFITLSPVSGEALVAWQNGRRGIGIHGGDLGAQGQLRATYGCLRLENKALEEVVALIRPEQETGRDVWYECVALKPEGQ